MKKLLLLLLLFAAVSSSASSQIIYLADTAFTTDIGYEGAPACCRANGAGFAGWGMNRALGNWLSDVFTVPGGSVWKFDTVILFGYLYGSTTTSPFLDCNLEIYNAPPGLGGSVIWGDTSTNVLVSTYFTGMYRVDTLVASGGITSNRRPIMYLKLYLSPAPTLSAGTYWLAWSCTALPSVNQPASIPKVLPGRINPTGQMGRTGNYGSWEYAVDNGLSFGFDKIIEGSAGLTSVPLITMNSAPMLSQNVPNPFSETTSICFYLSLAGYTNLSVYNVTGLLVATLINGELSAGNHTVTMNGSKLTGGIYYYKLSTPTGTESKPMILVK